METWYFDCCIGGRLSKYLSAAYFARTPNQTRRTAHSQGCILAGLRRLSVVYHKPLLRSHYTHVFEHFRSCRHVWRTYVGVYKSAYSESPWL